jgi:hypothetical protein
MATVLIYFLRLSAEISMTATLICLSRGHVIYFQKKIYILYRDIFSLFDAWFYHNSVLKPKSLDHLKFEPSDHLKSEP